MTYIPIDQVLDMDRKDKAPPKKVEIDHDPIFIPIIKRLVGRTDKQKANDAYDKAMEIL